MSTSSTTRRPEAHASGRRSLRRPDRSGSKRRQRPADPTHTNWRYPSETGAVEESRDTVPALAEGTEVIGEYADSGYREAPHIARRADGTVVQLTPLLSAVASRLDGTSTYAHVAREVTDEYGRELAAGDVAYLVEEKLRPLGLVVREDGSQPEVAKQNQLLQLTARAGVVPPGIVRGLAATFAPLFFGPIVLAVLGALVAFDVWLFGVQGVGQGIRSTLESPGLILASLGILVVSAALDRKSVV